MYYLGTIYNLQLSYMKMTKSQLIRVLTAATTSTITNSSFLSKITSLFTTSNLVMFVGLLTVGGSAFNKLKDLILNYLLTKYFICQTISTVENKQIVETYIKSICRDTLGDVRIRGEDELSKVSEATKEEEDVLTYDKDKFDIEVSNLPPCVAKFVHSTGKFRQ